MEGRRDGEREREGGREGGRERWAGEGGVGEEEEEEENQTCSNLRLRELKDVGGCIYIHT